MATIHASFRNSSYYFMEKAAEVTVSHRKNVSSVSPGRRNECASGGIQHTAAGCLQEAVIAHLVRKKEIRLVLGRWKDHDHQGILDWIRRGQELPISGIPCKIACRCYPYDTKQLFCV